MNSSGHKASNLLWVLLMGVCLAANGLCDQQGSTAKSPPNPPAPHPATTHTVATKAGTSATPSHPAAKSTTASHPATTKSASTKPVPHAASTYAARTAPNHAVAHTSPRAGSSAAKWRPRTLNGWQRLARLHLQPERVQEIQQALIREGYLRGDPTGQWDSQTHDAMLRYQTDHGFPATGLPEAKSLMKLGLASHPLPPELDHGPSGLASQSAAPGGLTATPSLPPVSQATPPQ